MYPIEWDTMSFDDLYRQYVAGDLDAHAFTLFCKKIREMRRTSTCPTIKWPSWICGLTTLEECIEAGVSPDRAEAMYRSGLLPYETLEDFCQLWRMATPRFSDVYREYERKPIRPNIVGPLGASVVARFLDYCNREVLFF